MATFGSITNSESYPSAGTVETVTPTTGQSIVISNGTNLYLINPAGTLLALTVTMPATPTDRQVIAIATTQIITGLTLSANTAQAILNVPTTLVLGGFCEYIWIAAISKWVRKA